MIKTQKSILQRFASDFYLEKVFPAIREKRTQQFITATLTLIAISFFGFFAISPTLTTIADLQKQLGDNKLVDDSLQQKIANLSTLEQKYNGLQADLPSVFSALPENPQIPLLLGQLQAIAAEHQLTITKIHTGDSVTIAPILTKTANGGAFTFSIDAHGSNDDILGFLNTVGSFERVISIDSILINKGTKTFGAPTNDVFVDIKGKAYFSPSI